jgi:hypothetical protein
MIKVKILCNKSPMRYSVRRIIEAAKNDLLSEYPDLELSITEISDSEEIMKYTQVMIAPGLVINEKLVYDLWIPKKEQVVGWLREAIQEQANTIDITGSG